MKTIRVVAAIIRDKDRIFATQRGYGDFKDGWEFPGGKIEEGETPREAIIREIKEELAADIIPGSLLTTVEYDYPEFHLSMDCFWAELQPDQNMELREHEAAKWLSLADIDSVDWLPADKEVVKAIKQGRVREATEQDLDALLELYLYLHEDSIPEKDDHLAHTWDQIIKDPNHHLIVYEKEGKIISSCVCVIIPNLTRNVRPYAFIENVVTHEDYRGNGYAGECLNYAKEIAQKENCYKMMLLTGSKKPETLRFYEKAGYNSSDKTAFIQWLG